MLLLLNNDYGVIKKTLIASYVKFELQGA